MNERKLFISYKHLVWCIILLTVTFQIIVFLVSYKSFFQDKFGFLRLLIIGSFMAFYGTVILKSEINSTAIHLFGVSTIYFLSICGVEMLVKYLNSDLLNNYIQFRVEEIMRNSAQELAGRGFQFDASASINAIEKSAIEEVSNKRTLYIAGLKMLLAIPCCYIFAFFKSSPKHKIQKAM